MGTESRHSDTYEPSKRALESFTHGKAWDLMQEVKRRPKYDPVIEPEGVIDLSGATNSLMRDWMKDYTETRMKPLKLDTVLTYGSITGSLGLLDAMAGFFNRFFHPGVPVLPSNIIAANGVTSLIDLVAWTFCDPGDAVLYLTPTFYMLEYDLSTRGGIVGVPVSTTHISDPFGGDRASLAQMTETLSRAADTASKNGHRPRMIFICNPTNPQGRSYSREMLVAIARFCAHRNMHLVADEIYALSQFSRSQFCSVLSVSDDQSLPTERMVHALYGVSKDFDMGGLRMGFLVTRNEELRAAFSRVTWFTWITAFSDAFLSQFISRLDLVDEYVSIYQERLANTYSVVSNALRTHHIGFEPATSGLFILVDLNHWVQYFQEPGPGHEDQDSPEIQLCRWLVENGVFLNPGQFAGSDNPGHFRLVFTEESLETILLAIHRIRQSLDRLTASNSACLQSSDLGSRICCKYPSSDDESTIVVASELHSPISKPGSMGFHVAPKTSMSLFHLFRRCFRRMGCFADRS